jgi:hypothetical protein
VYPSASWTLSLVRRKEIARASAAIGNWLTTFRKIRVQLDLYLEPGPPGTPPEAFVVLAVNRPLRFD